MGERRKAREKARGEGKGKVGRREEGGGVEERGGKKVMEGGVQFTSHVCPLSCLTVPGALLSSGAAGPEQDEKRPGPGFYHRLCWHMEHG